MLELGQLEEIRDDELNFLLLGDNDCDLEALKRLLLKAKIPEYNIDTSTDPIDVISRIQENASRAFRARVHMLMSLPNIYRQEIGRKILRKIQQLPSPPFTVSTAETASDFSLARQSTQELLFGNNESERVTCLTDNLIPRCKNHWQKTYDIFPDRPPTSPNSSLPPLMQLHTTDPLKLTQPLPCNVYDFDGTLLIPPSGSIASEDYVKHIYYQEKGLGGDLREQEALLRLFDSWREDRRRVMSGDPPTLNYDTFILNSGKSLGLSLKGVPHDRLEIVGDEFGTEYYQPHRFFPYAIPLIKQDGSFGLYSAVITGAPEVIMPPAQRVLGFPLYYGLRFVTDSHGICTGEIEINTGTKEGKHRIVTAMKDIIKIPILTAAGNSDQDSPLLDAALDSIGGYDYHGIAILTNPSAEELKEFGNCRYSAIKSGRLIIYETGTKEDVITSGVRTAIDSSLNANERNAGKIRRLLLSQGYSLPQIRMMFSQFMDSSMVETILNEHRVDMSDPRQIRAHGTRVNVSEEAIEEWAQKSTHHAVSVQRSISPRDPSKPILTPAPPPASTREAAVMLKDIPSKPNLPKFPQFGADTKESTTPMSTGTRSAPTMPPPPPSSRRGVPPLSHPKNPSSIPPSSRRSVPPSSQKNYTPPHPSQLQHECQPKPESPATPVLSPSPSSQPSEAAIATTPLPPDRNEGETANTPVIAPDRTKQTDSQLDMFEPRTPAYPDISYPSDEAPAILQGEGSFPPETSPNEDKIRFSIEEAPTAPDRESPLPPDKSK